MELLRGDRTATEVGKAYGVHPNTVNNWKRQPLENGAEVYAKDCRVAAYERWSAEMEQLLRKKEGEIALLRIGSARGDEHRRESGFRR